MKTKYKLAIIWFFIMSVGLSRLTKDPDVTWIIGFIGGCLVVKYLAMGAIDKYVKK